jgi:hypothetical protein
LSSLPFITTAIAFEKELDASQIVHDLSLAGLFRLWLSCAPRIIYWKGSK